MRPSLNALGAALAVAALPCGGFGHGQAWGAAVVDDDVARHLMTAPRDLRDQQRLVDGDVNGLGFSGQLITVSQGRVILPAATMRAIGLAVSGDAPLALTPDTGITVHYDEARGTLSLAVPAARLAPQRFAPDTAAQVRLSPESWGGYVDYDVNVRHEFRAAERGDLGFTSNHAADSLAQWGGLGELHLLAPDVLGGFGWGYDSERPAGQAAVRLDSTLTWRPAAYDLAASGGDAISVTSASVGEARAFRYGGLQIGTDFSAEPGWTSSPIPSVTGSAQAQSAIDVYLDGQRTFHADTPGGAFSLQLPPGSTGTATNVVVTDVTGRSVVIPIEVVRADAQLLRQGLFLWSAGLGAPRFAYGTSSSQYDSKLYGYAGLRYGAFQRATLTAHAEGGAGLAEGELGTDVSVTPWLAAHGSLSASRSRRGTGGAARVGLVASGPWGTSLDVAMAHTAGRFDDVVSVSGRTFAGARRFDPAFSLPAQSELSARLSWQPNRVLSLSASFQSDRYAGSPAAGFASLGGNYLIADSVPAYVNLSHAMGGQRTTAILAGVSFVFGQTSAAVSAGWESGRGAGPSGNVALSRPMGNAVGDYGWNLDAAPSSTTNFVSANAQLRTGYGVPGASVQSIGSQTTVLATLRGSAGVVGMHPFLSDPATGGLIIADVGRSGVPVQLNGFDAGTTSFDGKVALAASAPGVPQRIAIDTDRMPIDAIPSQTDQVVAVRDQGATVARFKVQSATASATLLIRYHGAPPPVGSELVGSADRVPISKEGRAYMPSLARDEILVVELPDGGSCRVATHFDGRGGVGRRIGPFACEDLP